MKIVLVLHCNNSHVDGKAMLAAKYSISDTTETASLCSVLKTLNVYKTPHCDLRGQFVMRIVVF